MTDPGFIITVGEEVITMKPGSEVGRVITHAKENANIFRVRHNVVLNF
jgi:hypothetical protein